MIGRTDCTWTAVLGPFHWNGHDLINLILKKSECGFKAGSQKSWFWLVEQSNYHSRMFQRQGWLPQTGSSGGFTKFTCLNLCQILAAMNHSGLFEDYLWVYSVVVQLSYGIHRLDSYYSHPMVLKENCNCNRIL